MTSHEAAERQRMADSLDVLLALVASAMNGAAMGPPEPQALRPKSLRTIQELRRQTKQQAARARYERRRREAAA